MSFHAKASRAYAATQGFRSLRDQESELFLRANAALRQSREAGSLPLVRALSDTSRLWSAVKASIVSVGLAVQREVDRPTPDIDFLIAVNADLAAGLAGPA